MLDGFIGKQIRRSNRNLFLANLGLLLVPLTIGFINPRYWYNFALGPFHSEHQTLLSIQDPEQIDKYFINIEGDKSFKTGLQEITKRVSKRTGSVKSETVSGEYIALVIDKKLLIVKAKTENAEHTKFTGELVNIPDNVQRDLISKAEAENPQLKGVFMPFILEENDFRFGGYLGLVVGLPCLVLSLWNLYKVYKRRANPEMHPIAKTLSQFGNSPEILAAKIDSEVQSESNKYSLGLLKITPSWLFRQTRYGLDILKLEQIAWIYAKVTQHRTNGIPTHKSYTAILLDRQGKSLEIPGKEQEINQLIEEIMQRVPWVIMGFSDEFQQIWNTDRSRMLEYLDERRQQVMSS